MTATLESVQTLAINVERGCSDACAAVVDADYVGTFYENPDAALSVAVLPDSGHAYEMGTSRVVRQNARVAVRRGYRYRRIDRADWKHDLDVLRASSSWRQGRPMPPSYMEPQRYGHDVPSVCLRHGSTVHGVIGPDRHLAAYAQVVQCGEVVRFNTILGHWDRLEDRCMWLLCLELIRWHIDECGARFALYYTHDSGEGGRLRYFKERLGFRPTDVRWVL